MNGTGKSGIYPDPEGGFVAKTNTVVRLFVRATSAADVLHAVRYGINRFHLSGTPLLSLSRAGSTSLL
jgi:hypothetical protein